MIVPFLARIDEAERGRWLRALRGAMPEHEILPFAQLTEMQRQGVEVAIAANPDPAELLQLPSLLWVQSLWAGVEAMLAQLAEAKNKVQSGAYGGRRPKAAFKIVRMTDPQLAATMAEAVLAWSLYLHRDMPLYARQQQRKLWRQHSVPLPQQRTIGVLGLGELGRAACKKLLCNEFRVLGWSRTRRQMDGVETFCGADGLLQLLGRSDIAVVLLPLTGQTRGLLDKKRLAWMKPGASLINFARGAIIDEPALLGALDNGHISHAALDVFSREPLPADSPLWDHPSITILPHISAPTNTTTASAIAAQNIHTFIATGEIPPAVDMARGY